MVPAALAGVDINKFLSRAKNAEQSCSPVMPAEANPGLQLGTAISAAATSGRDKLTLVIDNQISSLGLWIEQLDCGEYRQRRQGNTCLWRANL
jgi:hypothetical protein